MTKPDQLALLKQLYSPRRTDCACCGQPCPHTGREIVVCDECKGRIADIKPGQDE